MPRQRKPRLPAVQAKKYGLLQNKLMQSMDNMLAFIVGVRIILCLNSIRRLAGGKYSPIILMGASIVFFRYVYASMWSIILKFPSDSILFIWNHPYLFPFIVLIPGLSSRIVKLLSRIIHTNINYYTCFRRTLTILSLIKKILKIFVKMWYQLRNFDDCLMRMIFSARNIKFTQHTYYILIKKVKKQFGNIKHRKMILFFIFITIIYQIFHNNNTSIILGDVTTAGFNATLLKVYDGDTIFVRIEGVPPVFGERIGVRLYGIDAPELKGSKCEIENCLALKARALLHSILKETVIMQNVERGKYFSLVSKVLYLDTSKKLRDASKTILNAGYAVPYFGKAKTQDWCAKPALQPNEQIAHRVTQCS